MGEQGESFTPYDRADYLTGTEDVVAYLEAAIEEAGDDPAFLLRRLEPSLVPGTSATGAARDMSREGLYESGRLLGGRESFASALRQAIGRGVWGSSLCSWGAKDPNQATNLGRAANRFDQMRRWRAGVDHLS